MSRFKLPVKFSSIQKWIKEKYRLLTNTKLVKRISKLPKVVIFAVPLIVVLISANSVFWWYRATRGGFNFGKEPKMGSTREWEIDMDEQYLDEVKIWEEYTPNSLNTGNMPKEENDLEEEQSKLSQPADVYIPTSDGSDNEGYHNIAETVDEKTLPETVETASVALTTMSMPTTGRVIKPFAMDTLVYSKTLEQWNTHNGIDIAADIGTPVKAAMEGTVTEVISNDPKLGIVVIIDHGGGIKSLYGNLNSDKSTKKGTHVKKGQVIGAVGKTAPYEIEDPPHLHFEVLKDNKNIDPQQYLPKIN